MDKDTPTTGETAPVQTLPTNGTPSTPPVVKADDGEVERLKAELQTQMRANQLANEKLKAKEEAEAKAAQAKLEEDNQYKELFEQEKVKREALETERTEEQRTAELKRVKDEALSGVSDDVKKLAEEVGIELTDTDEKSVDAFKEKLGKISASAPTKVTPNNPGVPSSEKMTPEQLREVLYNDKSGDAFHELAMKMPGIASMTKQK